LENLTKARGACGPPYERLQKNALCGLWKILVRSHSLFGFADKKFSAVGTRIAAAGRDSDDLAMHLPAKISEGRITAGDLYRCFAQAKKQPSNAQEFIQKSLEMSNT